MKIPFDIKYRPQIESSEYKVETRDGRPARVVCWDRFSTEPYDNCNIVALVTRDKSESTYYYYQDGHLWNKANGEGDSPLDLFIVTPEEELTEFEQEVSDIVEYCKKNGKIVADGYAKRHAKLLLSIAREQFIKDGYVIEKKAFHDVVKKVDPKVMKEVSKNIDNTERTEFEQELINFFNEGNAILPDKDGMYNKRDCEEFLHKSASKLLAIAEKELTTKYKVSSDYNGFVYGQGYKVGMEDALKEKSRNITANLLDSKITGIQHELIQFASNIMEADWKDIIETSESYAQRIRAHVLKDLPRWKKIGQGDNCSSKIKFCINGRYLEMNDTLNDLYEISLKDLDKLPKEK